MKKTFALQATLAAIAPGFLLCAAAAAPGDWQAYGYDQGGARFSPLRQITPANVKRLTVAWTYHMNPDHRPLGTRTPFSTGTPLMVGGRIYLGTPYGRVAALDPDTGEELWSYILPAGDQPAQRGIAYWPGDSRHRPRLIFGTLQGRLIAVDSESGRASEGFGVDGVVDTRTPDVMNGMPSGFYAYTAPPAIYRNIAIIGSKTQESPTKGPSGDVRAWDVITGQRAWTFHSISRRGEVGSDSWQSGSTIERSGVNVWNQITVDAERGIAFLPFGAPAFDRYGGDRKGDNLFSDSLVAVEAATGRYLWHFQVTHHDVWDLDLHTPPALITVRKGGRDIPAVTAMNKAGLLFILNRVTGKPIHGVVERPVPQSLVDGEVTSPTQPFPIKPAPLTRTGFVMSEIADVTPELKAICQAMVDREKPLAAGLYEPMRSDRPTVRFPGAAGGPEWGGGAFDPNRRLFVVNANQIGYLERLTKAPDGGWSYTGTRFIDPKTRSGCHAPPWGELIGVNVDTGKIKWRSVLGVTDGVLPEKAKTGRMSNGGPIVTAGGLTFIGGTDDRRFRAFETKTGRELWAYQLDFSAHATPMTYEGKSRHQYVAIIATGGSYLGSPSGGDSLVAFALK
jgi:quinoprotein glucose dehydrogenase